MLAEFTMPKLGHVMEEGKIVKWLINEGDLVNAGDVILEIETEKSTLDVEIDFAGVIKKIIENEGAIVPINKTIAIVEKTL